MAEPVNCPKCKEDLTSRNRLITESCGHSKCRQCLISEENGCEQCNKTENHTAKVKEKINIIENRCLPSNATNLQSPEKSRPGKIEFPSHILKECIDDKLVYLCTICDKRFNSRTQQYYHLFCNNSSSKPYKCEICCKTFSTSSHLKYHMGGHSSASFECLICSKTFSRLQILRKHEKLHTAAAQQCIECGLKLKNKVAFKAHMQSHENIFPYVCDTCGRKFSLKSTLRMHKVVHNGTKQFKCDLCNKKFNRNSTLKLHAMRHSRQKNFSCSECFKQFIDMKSLMRHSKIHIGKSKYKCNFCDTTSIRKDNIIRHIKNMHPNEDKKSIKLITEDTNNTDRCDRSSEEHTVDNIATRTTSLHVYMNDNVVPKIVANSSVIRCIGNVQPVIVPQEKQQIINKQVKDTEKPNRTVVHSEATTHKKLKKKYDPCEIYRKILLDDDSTQENDTNDNIGLNDNAHTEVDQTKVAQETTVLYNGQQSNFSETHWRKNFKYTYQIQSD